MSILLLLVVVVVVIMILLILLNDNDVIMFNHPMFNSTATKRIEHWMIEQLTVYNNN